METKAKASLIVIAVFVIGFFTGIGVIATFLYVNKAPIPFERPFQDGPPSGIPERLLGKMTRSLDLSPDQQSEIRKIMEKTHDRLMDLRKKNRPAMRKIFEQSQKEIASILDAEQKENFDRLRKNMRGKFGRRGKRKKGMRQGRGGFGGFGPPPDRP